MARNHEQPQGGTRDKAKARAGRVNHYFQGIHDTITDLTTTKAQLADIEARMECNAQPDGYPVRRTTGGGGGSSSDTGDPTFKAATMGLPDDDDEVDDWRRHHVPDPLARAHANMLKAMVDARKAAEQFRRSINVILNAADGHRGREVTGGDCILCGDHVSGAENDRLRAGLDVKCYRRWQRQDGERLSVPQWVTRERAANEVES